MTTFGSQIPEDQFDPTQQIPFDDYALSPDMSPMLDAGSHDLNMDMQEPEIPALQRGLPAISQDEVAMLGQQSPPRLNQFPGMPSPEEVAQFQQMLTPPEPEHIGGSTPIQDHTSIMGSTVQGDTAEDIAWRQLIGEEDKAIEADRKYQESLTGPYGGLTEYQYLQQMSPQMTAEQLNRAVDAQTETNTYAQGRRLLGIDIGFLSSQKGGTTAIERRNAQEAIDRGDYNNPAAQEYIRQQKYGNAPGSFGSAVGDALAIGGNRVLNSVNFLGYELPGSMLYSLSGGEWGKAAVESARATGQYMASAGEFAGKGNTWYSQLTLDVIGTLPDLAFQYAIGAATGGLANVAIGAGMIANASKAQRIARIAGFSLGGGGISASATFSDSVDTYMRSGQSEDQAILNALIDASYAGAITAATSAVEGRLFPGVGATVMQKAARATAAKTFMRGYYRGGVAESFQEWSEGVGIDFAIGIRRQSMDEFQKFYEDNPDWMLDSVKRNVYDGLVGALVGGKVGAFGAFAERGRAQQRSAQMDRISGVLPENHPIRRIIERGEMTFDEADYAVKKLSDWSDRIYKRTPEDSKAHRDIGAALDYSRISDEQLQTIALGGTDPNITAPFAREVVEDARRSTIAKGGDSFDADFAEMSTGGPALPKTGAEYAARQQMVILPVMAQDELIRRGLVSGAALERRTATPGMRALEAGVEPTQILAEVGENADWFVESEKWTNQNTELARKLAASPEPISRRQMEQILGGKRDWNNEEFRADFKQWITENLAAMSPQAQAQKIAEGRKRAIANVIEELTGLSAVEADRVALGLSPRQARVVSEIMAEAERESRAQPFAERSAIEKMRISQDQASVEAMRAQRGLQEAAAEPARAAIKRGDVGRAKKAKAEEEKKKAVQERLKTYVAGEAQRLAVEAVDEAFEAWQDSRTDGKGPGSSTLLAKLVATLGSLQSMAKARGTTWQAMNLPQSVQAATDAVWQAASDIGPVRNLQEVLERLGMSESEMQDRGESSMADFVEAARDNAISQMESDDRVVQEDPAYIVPRMQAINAVLDNADEAMLQDISDLVNANHSLGIELASSLGRRAILEPLPAPRGGPVAEAAGRVYAAIDVMRRTGTDADSPAKKVFAEIQKDKFNELAAKQREASTKLDAAKAERLRLERALQPLLEFAWMTQPKGKKPAQRRKKRLPPTNEEKELSRMISKIDEQIATLTEELNKVNEQLGVVAEETAEPSSAEPTASFPDASPRKRAETIVIMRRAIAELNGLNTGDIKLRYDNGSVTLSKPEQELSDWGKKFGVTVVFARAPKPLTTTGAYHAGVVFINQSQIDSPASWFKIAMHEGVHHMRQVAPEVFNDLYRQLNRKVGKSLRAIGAKYTKKLTELTENSAVREAALTMLNDDAGTHVTGLLWLVRNDNSPEIKRLVAFMPQQLRESLDEQGLGEMETPSNIDATRSEFNRLVGVKRRRALSPEKIQEEEVANLAELLSDTAYTNLYDEKGNLDYEMIERLMDTKKSTGAMAQFASMIMDAMYALPILRKHAGLNPKQTATLRKFADDPGELKSPRARRAAQMMIAQAFRQMMEMRRGRVPLENRAAKPMSETMERAEIPALDLAVRDMNVEREELDLTNPSVARNAQPGPLSRESLMLAVRAIETVNDPVHIGPGNWAENEARGIHPGGIWVSNNGDKWYFKLSKEIDASYNTTRFTTRETEQRMVEAVRNEVFASLLAEVMGGTTYKPIFVTAVDPQGRTLYGIATKFQEGLGFYDEDGGRNRNMNFESAFRGWAISSALNMHDLHTGNLNGFGEPMDFGGSLISSAQAGDSRIVGQRSLWKMIDLGSDIRTVAASVEMAMINGENTAFGNERDTGILGEPDSSRRFVATMGAVERAVEERPIPVPLVGNRDEERLRQMDRRYKSPLAEFEASKLATFLGGVSNNTIRNLFRDYALARVEVTDPNMVRNERQLVAMRLLQEIIAADVAAAGRRGAADDKLDADTFLRLTPQQQRQIINATKNSLLALVESNDIETAMAVTGIGATLGSAYPDVVQVARQRLAQTIRLRAQMSVNTMNLLEKFLDPSTDVEPVDPAPIIRTFLGDDSLARLRVPDLGRPKTPDTPSDMMFAITAPDTTEFTTWFADSKVVDAEGKPMLMFHGTPNGGYRVFWVDKRGAFGPGAYFSNKPTTANTYALSVEGVASVVYPTYLRIENPWRPDATANVRDYLDSDVVVKYGLQRYVGGNNSEGDQYIRDAAGQPKTNYAVWTELLNRIQSIELTRAQNPSSEFFNESIEELDARVQLEIRASLIKKGYDGVITTMTYGENPEIYAVVWEANQVKSFTNLTPRWENPEMDLSIRGPSDMQPDEYNALLAEVNSGRYRYTENKDTSVGALYAYDDSTGMQFYRVTRNETPEEYLNRRFQNKSMTEPGVYSQVLARMMAKLPASRFVKIVSVDRPIRPHARTFSPNFGTPIAPVLVMADDDVLDAFIHELAHAYVLVVVENEIFKFLNHQYRNYSSSPNYGYYNHRHNLTGTQYVEMLRETAKFTTNTSVRDLIGAYLTVLAGLAPDGNRAAFYDQQVGDDKAHDFTNRNAREAWLNTLLNLDLLHLSQTYKPGGGHAFKEGELDQRLAGVLWEPLRKGEPPVRGNRSISRTTAQTFGYAMTDIHEFVAQLLSDRSPMATFLRQIPLAPRSFNTIGRGGMVEGPMTGAPGVLSSATPLLVAEALVGAADAEIDAVTWVPGKSRSDSAVQETTLNTIAAGLAEMMNQTPAAAAEQSWRFWKSPAPYIDLNPRHDDAIRYAVGAIEPIPGSLKETSRVTAALEIARGQKFDTIRDFKERVQEAVRAAAERVGVNLLTTNKAKMDHIDDYLVDVGYDDALTALSLQTSAIGWYNEKVRKALAVLSLTYPELATSKQDQFAMIVALAITSNGLDVVKANFPLGASQYEQYKRTGRFPENVGQGTSAKAMMAGFWKVNQLIDKHGIDWVMEFFSTKRTVAEVQKMSGFKISKEAQSDLVYGAAILGGKIGNGFFANMYGHYEQLTIDRWLMRTWGRWTGTLIMLDKANIAKKMKAVRAELLALPDSDLERIGSELGMTLTKGKIKTSNQFVGDLANRIARRTSKDAFREFMSGPTTDTLRKAARSYSQYEDGSVESPDSIAIKQRMRRVFNRILDRLRIEKPDLTMADLQAVFWYPEKRLYETSKANTRDNSTLDDDLSYSQGGLQDFETAARGLAVARGISEKDINNAVAKIDADLAAERAGRPAVVADERAGGGRRTPDRTGRKGKARGSEDVMLALADEPANYQPANIIDAERVIDLSLGDAEARSALEERLQSIAENWRGSMRRFAQRADLPLLNTEGAEDIEVVEKPADISPFWKFVAAPINIAIASKNADVISVVEDMIAMDVERNMTTEARKQEARFVWESIPADERNEEEFARYMDEYHDPATIDEDPEFSTKSQAWRSALKWFKEREEIRRQEIIETKREGVARMLKRDNAARLVSRAAQLGMNWEVTRNPAGRKVIKTDSEALITLDQARDRLVKKMVSDDWGMQYAHFFHWFNGEYKLVGYKEDGTREIIGSAMTEPEAFERLYAYRRANPGVYAKLSAEPAMRINPDDAVRLSDAQRRRLTKLLADATGAYRDDVSDAMRGIIGSRTSKRPFYAPLMTRTGAKGFSEKFMDVWDMSERLHNRWKMGGEMVRVLTPRIESIRRDTPGWGDYLAESMRHTLFTAPTSAEAAIDSFVKAIPVVGKMTGPFFTRRLLESVRWLNYARQLVTVRQQVVNSFQPFQTLYPILGEKGFMEAVSFYNSDEGREVLRRFGTIRGNGKFYEGSESRLGTEIAEFVGTMNDRIYKATNENFDPSSESRNQNFAFVAMYLHGKNKGMTDEEAARYGRIYGNVYTQFYYTKANIPWLLRGPIASTALQYRRFAINTTGLLVNEFQRGNYSGVSRYLATMSMLGGMQASIGLSAISLIRSAYLGDKEGADDLAFLMRKWLIKNLGSERMADVAMMGLPAAIGIDMSGSLSIWQKPFGRNLYEKIGASISGPSVNTALQIYTNLTSETAIPIGTGERIGRAIMDSSPTAQQIISMWKVMSGENQYYDARGRLQYTLDPEEQWMKMGAFRTVSESVWSMEYQRLRIIRNEVDRYADRAATLLAGNQVAEARKVLREFNSLYPMASMSFDDIKRRVEQKRESRTMPQLQRRVEVETGTIAREIAKRERLGQ